jgi:hypothetical protein
MIGLEKIARSRRRRDAVTASRRHAAQVSLFDCRLRRRGLRSFETP